MDRTQDNDLKPIRKIEIIERIYWECNIPEHRHKTEKSAMSCMIARPVKRSGKGKRDKWIMVAKAITKGATYKEAGASVGLSAERARQVAHKLFRISTHPNNLSNRPEGIYNFDIKVIRENAKFWSERVDYMAKKWGVTIETSEGAN